jgi:pyruvate formate lyase activating enzyme
MIDWEGMLASTVFLPGCNFRCPFCQNPDLVLAPRRLETVPLSAVRDYIADREGWVEGVCITGGEPCMHSDLPGLCETLKSDGMKVKLDTNGSFPSMVEALAVEGLVDFVALDIKAPLEPGPYRAAIGVEMPDALDNVLRTVDFLRGSGLEREFRTTLVPMMHGPAEVARIAEFLRGEERYILQYFSPRDTLDPRYSALRPFTEEDMEGMLEEARRFIPGAKARGAPASFDG